MGAMWGASGRSRPVRPLEYSNPRLRGGRLFIAALRHDRLDAPWVIDGAINREFFDLYVETQLAPTLHKGDVVILDNLATHRSPKAAEILKDIGARFLFLPPYSPDPCAAKNSPPDCFLYAPHRSKWHSPRSKP